jgi:HSP20 family molecular chaperone IbpA
MYVSEDLDHYYVRALIPGIDASQLDVSVVNQTIAVSGTRQSPAEEGVG